MAFTSWGGVKLTKLVTPAIQVIMFGMGTTLTLADFMRVAKCPWAVAAGVVLQFLIMPLVGFALALAMGFSGELAAACKRRGMKLGLYYSNPDWHHPNAYNPLSTHQVPPELGDKPDMAKYREYVKAQITELLTNYGEIVCLFWDIPTKIAAPEMDELVLRLQPGIKINDRGWGNVGGISADELANESVVIRICL